MTLVGRTLCHVFWPHLGIQFPTVLARLSLQAESRHLVARTEEESHHLVVRTMG